MAKSVTLRDVAAYAGVSITTVSNVVRKWPYVSSEMRDRVQQAIDVLGYTPHIVAQGLRTGQTQALAFVVPDLSNPYFAEIVAAAEDAAQNSGYTLLVFNSHEDPAREATCIQRASKRWADGLLITHSHLSQWPDSFWDNIDIPVVIVDRIPDHTHYPICSVDNLRVGQLATEHLVGLGHRQIAHIAGPQAVRLAVDRSLAYTQILDAHGIEYRQVVYSGAGWGASDGYSCMRGLLAETHRPTAVFTSNDRVAIGALHAIYEHGLRVPDDISLVGVDDIEISAHLNPPLTTVRQPLDKLAALAVDHLLRLIRGEALEDPVTLLQPELIIRQSTAPLSGGRS
ncbi:MAG: LacI family DNA-binding transcriptional regulator [Anaerolineae bacterium]|nr:LacI family DNA-binding transcriptional regulator [Anaerolineae bacterium]